MPKIVDHDLRRREVAQAAVRVIARDGLEAATTRAVAEESGWTTGVLKHYFSDKNDVLNHALRELNAVNDAVFEAVEREPTGIDAIRLALTEILRTDPDHSKVWIALISRAATDEAAAAEMRRGSRAWQHRWAQLVRRGQLDGSVDPELDADQLGVELHAFTSGLRIASLFNPARSPTTRRLQDGKIAMLEAIRPAGMPSA